MKRVKRKYISDDEAGPESDYVDVACPDCEAPITLRFHRGRRSRDVVCPVCRKKVTIFLESPSENLIQILKPPS